MEDTIKKAYLLGLGAAALTIEATDKLVKELVAQGKLDSKDGKVLVNKVIEESKRESEKIQKQLDKQVRDALTRLDVVTRKELKELEAEIHKLASGRPTAATKRPTKARHPPHHSAKKAKKR